MARLAPGHAFLGTGRQRLLETVLWRFDLVEGRIERLSLLRGPARTDSPGIDEVAAIPIAERERANQSPRGCGREVPDNEKFLTAAAFRLEPVLATSRLVRKVLALGDDPLKPEAA